MSSRYLGSILSIAIILILSMPQIGLAGDVRTNSTSYGAKAGLVMPGIWYVGDYEYDVDMNYSLSGFLDYKLGPKITGGASLDLHGFYSYEESGMLMDLGVNIKAMIYGENSKMVFRPGIGISYGHLGKMGIYEASNYLMLKGFLELVFASTGSYSWLGEIGIFGAPNGGNDDAEMALDTGLMLRGGIVF